MKTTKAFSIAEALITLMIVSLILAAVIPVVSKKSKTSDAIWHYVVSGSGSNSDIYYGTGNSQTMVLGDVAAPVSSTGSRILLMTPAEDASSSNYAIRRSLIDFYQKTATGQANTGRISFDAKNNTAVGASTLLNNSSGVDNVALGFHSLLANTSGSQNTAVGVNSSQAITTGIRNTSSGFETLLENQVGSSNVAVGFFALRRYAGSNNTSVGAFSLSNIIDQQNNTAVGFSAANGSTGSANTAIGSFTLAATSSGVQNTAVGDFALNQNTGDRNTATGAAALQATTNGSNNTAMGFGALTQNISGWSNVAMGFQSLAANQSNSDSTAVGAEALRASTGGANTAVGSHAGFNQRGGSANSMFGVNAMRGDDAVNQSLYTGTSNTALGTQTLMVNRSGSNNVAVGSNSIIANLTGNNNTAVGVNSLVGLTSGERNVALGVNAGSNFGPDSTGNIAIGSNAGPTFSGTWTNQLYIDNTTRNDPLIGGNFLVRTATIGGNLTVSGTVSSASDIRLKNIQGEYKDGLNKIMSLHTVRFTYKKDKSHHLKAGVIAQELQKIMPNAVTIAPDGYFYVDTSEILFALVNSVKELNAKIQLTDKKNNFIDIRVKALEKENSVLKQKLSENSKLYESEMSRQRDILKRQEKELMAQKKEYDQLNKRMKSLESR